MNLLKLLCATLTISILFSTFLFSPGNAAPHGFIAEKHPECIPLSNQPYEDDSAAEYISAIQTGGVPLILSAFKYKIHDPALFETAFEAEQIPLMEKSCFNKQQLSKRFKHPSARKQQPLVLIFYYRHCNWITNCAFFRNNKTNLLVLSFLAVRRIFIKCFLRQFKKNIHIATAMENNISPCRMKGLISYTWLILDILMRSLSVNLISSLTPQK